MKIRLHGTEDECQETVKLLGSIMLIQSVSEPYPDRGRSVLVRVYVEVRLPRSDANSPHAAAWRTELGL